MIALAALLLSTALADEGEPALLVERAAAALREQRAADARQFALESLSQPSWPAVMLYLDACEADGLFEVCLSAVEGLAAGDEQIDAIHRWARVQRGLAPADILGEVGGEGKDVATLALASVALNDGSPEVTVAMLSQHDQPEARSLVLAALVDQGLDKEALAAAKQLMADWPDRPELLAALWSTDASKKVGKQRKRALEHARSRLVSIDPVVAYRVLALAIAADDDPLAEAAAARVQALGDPLPLDRVPWNANMRRDLAKGLARVRNPTLPAGTDSEREDIAIATAWALRDLGRVDEAIELYQRAREGRDSARLAIEHANQLLRMGRLKDAKQISREAVRLAARAQPGDSGRLRADRDDMLATAWATLAFVLSGREELPDALSAITTANALHPQGDWFYLAAGLQAQLGDGDAAFVSYAIADALGMRGAREAAMGVYRGIGDPEDAMFAVVQQWSSRQGDDSVSVALETAAEREVLDRLERPAVGRPMRDFTITTQEGELTAADLKGQVVVLNFWATWCGPCQEELPAYAKVARRLQKKGLPVTFVAVSVDSRQRDFDRWQPDGDVSGLQVAWSREMGKAWRVEALPTTWLVDAEGVLQSRHTGFQSGVEDELEQDILQLLPDSPDAER